MKLQGSVMTYMPGYRKVPRKEKEELILSKSLDDNVSRLKHALNDSFDIRSRKFKVGDSTLYGTVMYIDNLARAEIILEHIIKPLTAVAYCCGDKPEDRSDYEVVKDSLISTGDIKEDNTFDKIVLAILAGDTLVLLNGYDKGLIMNTHSFSGRTIDIPMLEPSVKGPKEGFVENLRENIGLIRKRLRDPNLTLEQYPLGRRSKVSLVLVYVKGIANQKIINEVRKRIQSIDTDDGVASAQVSQLFNDRPNSIFPLIQVTERPDKVITSILEGRVAVILEGAPGVNLVPVTLPILMQSADDYYEAWIVSSLIRLGRFIALFVSALFPALYIALTAFHPGVLPTNIVLSITSSRMGVPFPAFIEALMMTAVLELLIEAGIRLPKVVGQTVSIVGGLVIGQAAVEAGVISPVMVIIIAITAISSFAIPDYSLGLATRVLRLPFMFSAAIFGTVGTSMLLLVVLGYTCSLESFGIGYLEPMTPYRLRDWKDTLIRGPQYIFGKRPEFLSPEDTQRQIIRKKGDPGVGKE